MSRKPALFLFDEKENFEGVLISPELWEKIAHHVEPFLKPEEEEPLPPEPIADWNTLLDYWDFPYPVEYSVECGHCGAKTENWQEDEPRKFHLNNATLGGLVVFQCLGCKAKIQKRHFKKEIKTETIPFREKKNPKLNAFYG